MDLENRNWHYSQSGAQQGPIPTLQLRSMVERGELGPQTLIWCEGMTDWQSYEKVFVGNTNLPEQQTPDTSSSSARGQLEIDDPSALPVSSEMFYPMPCIQWAWELTLKKFGLLVGYGALYLVMTFAVSFFFGIIQNGIQFLILDQNFEGSEYLSIGIGLLLEVLDSAIGIFFSLGLIRVALNVVGGEFVSLATLLSEGKNYWNALLASILFYLMLIVGLLLLVVPGIYVAIRFGQYMHAIVDRKLGPIESLEYSAKLTKDRCMSLFGFYIVTFLITVAGALCLLIGLLWAIPCVTLAQVFVYRYLQGGETLVADLRNRRFQSAPLTPGVTGA